jgi:hypothetical protein
VRALGFFPVSLERLAWCHRDGDERRAMVPCRGVSWEQAEHFGQTLPAPIPIEGV